MRKTLLTVLLAAAAAVGCQTKASNDNSIIELPSKSFKAQWTRNLDLEGQKPRDMYVAGDDLFIYTSKNVLYRMNRKSGDVIYISNAAMADSKVSAPLKLDSQLVIPADMKLEFLDARGFHTKTIDLKSPMRSGLAGDAKGIYVGIDAPDGKGRLVCIDLDKPFSPFRWQLQTGGSIVSSPALFGGNVYAASDDGKIYAVDRDRTAVWPLNDSAFGTGGQVHGGVVADASGVYAASADSKLYCLGLRDGKIRWQFFAQAPLYETPAVTATTVYQYVRGHGVVALDKGESAAFNRIPRWVVKEAVGFLAEDEKLAFLRGEDNTILAVDKASGEVKFANERTDLVAFAVNTTDGLIYAATRKGKVFAAVPVTKPGVVGEMVFVTPQEAHETLAAR